VAELNTNQSNEQDSEIESSKEQDNNSEILSRPPIIPVVETTYLNPRSPSSISFIPPELLAPLARAKPSDLFKFIGDHNEGERKLRELTISNQYALDLKREEDRNQASLHTKQLSQFAMGIFAALFSGVLLYAHVAGDKALPDSIIKLMTGALAGGGGVTLLNQNKKKDKE